jgi:membrane protease YdiL (CAAX protease family)
MSGVASGVSSGLTTGLLLAAAVALLWWRAGLVASGMAFAFQRTGRLEAAILGHFAVNAAHFLLLFTCPYSA